MRERSITYNIYKRVVRIKQKNIKGVREYETETMV